METPRIDHDLHDVLVALVHDHGPMSRDELTRRARRACQLSTITETSVGLVADVATLLVSRPDGCVAHLAHVLDGIVLTHRVRGSLADRTDLWLGPGVQPFLAMAALAPLPLHRGGEARISASAEPALVGPQGWLPAAERGDLVALRWSEGSLAVAPVATSDLAGPTDQEHVRRLVAERVNAESWFAGDDPDARAGRVVRAVGLARLEDPHLLSTPHPPLDEMLYDPFETQAGDHWRSVGASRQAESISFCIDRMPVALDMELRARARQWGMSLDQFVIAILGHLAWRTPFAEDIEPWDQWLPEKAKGRLVALPGRPREPDTSA